MLRVLLVLLIAYALVACGGSDSSTSSSNDGGSTTTPTTDDPVDVNHNISGQIFVPNNQAKDNDTNDISAPNLASNNTADSAQSVPNPVILGGYVNQPGAGPAGKSQLTGDVSDFYRAQLRQGQTVILFVASQNLTDNDLDLNLRDTSGNVLNASVGVGQTESVQVPKDDDYFIQVEAFIGASNYVLSIGQNISTTATRDNLQLQNDFVVGEALVEMHESGVTVQGWQALSNNTGRRNRWQLASGELLALSQQRNDKTFTSSELAARYDTLMQIKSLRRDKRIKSASPNYYLHAMRTPNDNFYRYQWSYGMIKLPQAWDVTRGSTDVVAAVIDTGVLLNHPDLSGKLLSGYDFIADSNVALDGNGLDNNPDDPGDQSSGGSTFHGSHVAGTIGALTDNSEGVAGSGWNTMIMPLRVLGKNGSGTEYDTEQAVRYAARISNDSNTLPSRAADIINLSLGGSSISSSFEDVLNQARNRGIIIVAAAGNEATSSPGYPAALPGVISVSAVDINRQLASYSNFGSTIDVAAPGGDNTPDVNGDGIPDGVVSTAGDDRSGQIEFSYVTSNGTSMASPHVAGVIALMKAVNPNLTPLEFDTLLSNGAITDDIGSAGKDNSFGYGLINAYKAVSAAIELTNGNVPSAPAFLTVNPTSLNFGSNVDQIDLVLSNSGGGTLSIGSIETADASSFLQVRSTSNVDTNGLGTYEAVVDRSQLSTGTYTATIRITTIAVNTVEIPVILEVGNTDIGGDAGLHYILLVDPDTSETIKQTRANAQDGVYSYQILDIPSGNYQLVAGNDNDNDGYICEVGEACGAYLTVERPSVLSVTRSITGVNFNTGYNINFVSSQSQNDLGPFPVTQTYRREQEEEDAVMKQRVSP